MVVHLTDGSARLLYVFIHQSTSFIVMAYLKPFDGCIVKSRVIHFRSDNAVSFRYVSVCALQPLSADYYSMVIITSMGIVVSPYDT